MFLSSISFSTSQDQYDTDEMSKEFVSKFPRQAFSRGQQLAFYFKNKLLSLVVKHLEGICV